MNTEVEVKKRRKKSPAHKIYGLEAKLNAKKVRRAVWANALKVLQEHKNQITMNDPRAEGAYEKLIYYVITRLRLLDMAIKSTENELEHKYKELLFSEGGINE